MISKAQLLTIMPGAARVADASLGPLNDAMTKYGITSSLNCAAFLATLAEESEELQWTRENLNYDEHGLRTYFAAQFADSEFTVFAKHPMAIANRVYDNRLGNGNEASGDGWMFRGAGWIQLTGRGIITKYAAYSKLDCVNHPELLQLPANAADSAGWVWAVEKNLNKVGDVGDIRAATKAVNGGYNGWIQRKAYFEKAKAIL